MKSVKFSSRKLLAAFIVASFPVIGFVSATPSQASGTAGTTWTSRTAAAENSWRSVTFGNGLFVAVSTNGMSRVMTSPDGTTWTSRTAAAENSWRSVTFGNGLFVAVSTDGTNNRVMTSPDGITWTSRASVVDNAWRSVTFGAGLFVAVSTDGTNNRVMTSPDGITWTSRTSAANNQWRSVTFGNGLFVAVDGFTGVMTSPDGITWTSRTGVAGNFESVTFGNGIFVAVSSTGTTQFVMRSNNGSAWSIGDSPAAAWYSVTFANGLFVAVGRDSVMTSPDGENWTSRTAAALVDWQSVVYANGLFVAVANSGTGRVMTSGIFTSGTPGTPTETVPAPPPQKQHVSTLNTSPAPGETVSMFGSFFERVTEAFVGGVKVEIVSKSDNRVNLRMPRGLTGALDVELKSPLGSLLLPKHFTIGKLPAAGGQQRTLIVGGFDPNSRKLTARMQARIDRWLERNSDLSTLTCTGFTSLPRRTTDVQLSTNRGTTACSFAKSQRPDLTTSVSQGVEDPRPGSNVRRVKLVLTP